MRGAQDAGRHTAEILRLGPRSAAHSARALARDVAERASERAEAPPSRSESDLGDRQVRIAEQRRRAFDASREQVAVRRHAERLLERSREVSGGDATHTRESPHGPLLVRSGVHAILRPQQAAQ